MGLLGADGGYVKACMSATCANRQLRGGPLSTCEPIAASFSAAPEGIDDLYSAGCSQAGMSRCPFSTPRRPRGLRVQHKRIAGETASAARTAGPADRVRWRNAVIRRRRARRYGGNEGVAALLHVVHERCIHIPRGDFDRFRFHRARACPPACVNCSIETTSIGPARKPRTRPP